MYYKYERKKVTCNIILSKKRKRKEGRKHVFYLSGLPQKPVQMFPSEWQVTFSPEHPDEPLRLLQGPCAGWT